MTGTRVPTAERLHEKGKGVWIGWHRDFGWVFLDRRNGRDSRATLPFARGDTWTVFEDLHANWKPPLYSYWPNRLAALATSEAAKVEAELEALCQEFERRSSTLQAQVDAISKAREEERRRAEEEERHRADQALDRRLAEAAERQKQRKADDIARLRARLLGRQRANEQAIRDLIAARGIQALVHFTRTENLESILRRGIVPRASLEEGDFRWNDERRDDGYPEASCLSVSFPNYKMFYDIRTNRYPEARWAVVLLSPEVLMTHPCMFFDSNAAWYGCRALARSDERSVTGIEGLEGMFTEDAPGLRAQLGLQEDYTTDPQAEVLVFDVVHPVLMRGVRLAERDAALMARLKAIVPEVEVKTDRALFEWRKDFSYWKDRRGARVRNSIVVDGIEI